ncbi:MAG: NAD-binding protein [Bacteroidales bacterium]|jgi:trk system potassium uptake protein TrkA|nr:NAD-binding protein [Bacteroidales bacterium]
MKFAIISLGKLGQTLAVSLTKIGHEILGIDGNPQNIDAVKHDIHTAMLLDSTDEEAVSALSLEKLDGVFVAYSKDFGRSVETVAILKKLGVKNIIARSISVIHTTVLQSIGIEKIMEPEYDYAVNYVLKMISGGHYQDRLTLSPMHEIFIVDVPKSMVGEKILGINFDSSFHLHFVALRKKIKTRNLIGMQQIQYEIVEHIAEDTTLEDGDSIVFLGQMEHLKIFRNM